MLKKAVFAFCFMSLLFNFAGAQEVPESAAPGHCLRGGECPSLDTTYFFYPYGNNEDRRVVTFTIDKVFNLKRWEVYFNGEFAQGQDVSVSKEDVVTDLQGGGILSKSLRLPESQAGAEMVVRIYWEDNATGVLYYMDFIETIPAVYSAIINSSSVEFLKTGGKYVGFIELDWSKTSSPVGVSGDKVKVRIGNMNLNGEIHFYGKYLVKVSLTGSQYSKLVEDEKKGNGKLATSFPDLDCQPAEIHYY